MNVELLLFSVFAALALATAVGVVALRDPIRAALSLIGSFFSLACLYLLQKAELIAVLEVLVYAGAIMVLFVFVIMLVEQHDEPVVPQGLLRRVLLPLKIGAVALVGLNVLRVVVGESFAKYGALAADFGSSKAVGRKLFSDYIFHFELTSVLLLAAIVGAVVVSRQSKDRPEGSKP